MQPRRGLGRKVPLGCGVVEVETARAVEGFFGGAGEVAGRQDRVLVAVFAGEVAGEAPSLGCAGVAEPAQLEGAVVVSAADVRELGPVADFEVLEGGPAFTLAGGEALLEPPPDRLGDAHLGERTWLGSGGDVALEAGHELGEVVAAERPVERFGNGVVAVLERGEPLGDLVGVGEVVGVDDLRCTTEK
jgi:hypothetical protein